MATQVVSTKIGLKNLSERIKLNTGKEIIIEETAKGIYRKSTFIIMNVLIVENEKPAAEVLSRLLKKIDNTINILATTESVGGDN